MSEPLKIGIPLFHNYALIDVMGPLQVLGSMSKPPAEIFLVAESRDPVKSVPITHVVPDTTFDDCPTLDVLVVPGGAGDFMDDDVTEAYIDFVRHQAHRVKVLVSVCVGALILEKAGLLKGQLATTHWAALGKLGEGEGVTVATGYPRYVIGQGAVDKTADLPQNSYTLVTGAGLSAGIDQAFAVVALLAGAEEAKGVQLAIQYAPDPPYRDGDPSQASPDAFDRTFEVFKRLTELSSEG